MRSGDTITSVKLGEMLLRDGHVTPDQIDLAVARQARDGGRFGTVLVEMGFVDLETLTVYLGLELSLPIATGGMLDRAKRTAVRLLTPQQAHRFRCVPLLISDRNLIAAVDDPHDLVVLDELSRVTGYRVIPRVAPEIRIFYYLERYYGVKRPPRFEVFGEKPRGQRQPPPPATGTKLPGPSLPGLPPPTETPVAAPRPAPRLRTSSDADADADRPPTVTPRRARTEPPPIPDAPPTPAAAQTSEEIDALEIDAQELVVELEADAAETADEAPPAAAFDAMAPAASAGTSSYPSLSLDETLEAMQAAGARGEVADALMGFASSLFDTAALLIVRDNLAFGWKGFGDELNLDRLEALLLPMDAPSIVQAAVHSDDGMFSGPLFPAALHRYLYKVLRTPMPSTATVAAVTIGRRIVNLLYGHKRDGAPLSDGELAELSSAVTSTATGYVRLIAMSKTRINPNRADTDVGDTDDLPTDRQAAVDASE